ncbi:MAG: hypothetical protein M1834_002579 [Cirrosporium novae-zelandiae]|nr:MAG: hypothetical protein M1834_002579 [Cirrosporium novae-zelandiae]
MKQRFSSLDVKVIAHELSKSFLNLRLANIYDLSSRIFLFKFQKPGHRQQLLLDSGFRCHITNYARATADAPSPFVSRLRKFLKTRRVTSVSQVGTDRIIDIQFSDGQYRLFLEFYAGGNIILTDNELKVLALQRIVPGSVGEEEVRIGLTYSLPTRQDYNGTPPLTLDRVKDVLEKGAQQVQAQSEPVPKKKYKRKGDALKRTLGSGFKEFPGVLIDHAIMAANFDSSIPLEQILKDESLLGKILDLLREAKMISEDVVSSDISKGYIISKVTDKKEQPSSGVDQQASDENRLLYEDFHPFIPLQFKSNPTLKIIEIEGFNKTVDQFYSSIESQKLESRLIEREELAKKKLEKVRSEHDKRLGGLQQVQELNVRKAQAIEANLQRVEEAIAAVNGLIGQGMDWAEIGLLIEIEQKRHNPVAEMIKLPLKLYENTATLLLSEAEFDDYNDYEGDETDSAYESQSDEEEPSTGILKKEKTEDKRLTIDVDLSLSPWANAREYYDQKRNAAVKEQKTIQSSTKALKAQEKKISADLKKGLKQEKQVLRPVREQFWFEKFIFFISSDGYLVIGGRDAQQNELIYRRYLKKGDVYVHADLEGAASIIIKNNLDTPDAPIPPSTLSQAGTLAIATSSAWDSKAVMSAWWVNADQVSKTASTGDVLSAGNFMIKGQKNFLPPAQLLLGFAVMFQISEESKANHSKHRLQENPETPVPHQDTANSREAAERTGEPSNKEEEDASNTEAVEQNEEKEQEENTNEQAESDSDISEDESEEQEQDTAAFQLNPLQTSTLLSSEQDVEKQSEHEESTVDPEGDGGDSSGDEEEIEHYKEESSSATAFGGIRHLSAKQRRLLRKGLDPASQPSTPTTPSRSSTPGPSNPTTQQTSNLQHLPRGKRAKAKKALQKYKDQTPEDRELAIRLLGADGGQKKALAAAGKEKKEEEQEEAKKRRREQHFKLKEAVKKHEEKKLQQADGTGGDSISNKDNPNETKNEQEEDEETAPPPLDLATLIGTPHPADTLLSAIPMCAPWTSLTHHKYRAKLQPGTTKKGKAIREILGRWNEETKDSGPGGKPRKGESEEEARLRRAEGEVIRMWRDVEVVGVVPVGKVRVLMGGGSGNEKGKGGGGGAGQRKGKGGNRGGKGSKKQR